MPNLKLAIVGAGGRGEGYARLAAESGRAEIVAVADPDPLRRQELADAHGIPEHRRFQRWEDLAAETKLADAVVIATPDQLHVEPAIAFANKGYHILLEKPMAPTEEESIRIVEASESNGITLMVCHAMRYSNYTRILKSMLDAGRIGEIAAVEHLEPIGWWHFAHSYVRGPWGREETSSPMLLAKSCHDVDWLNYILGSA